MIRFCRNPCIFRRSQLDSGSTDTSDTVDVLLLVRVVAEREAEGWCGRLTPPAKKSYGFRRREPQVKTEPQRLQEWATYGPILCLATVADPFLLSTRSHPVNDGGGPILQGRVEDNETRPVSTSPFCVHKAKT